MAKNRDINYNDWTKNTARRQGVWVSYRNPNDNTYYAVKETIDPIGRIDPNDENKTIYEPMTTAQLAGPVQDDEYGLGINVYNHGRYGIRHITKKVLKTEYKVLDTRYRVEGRVERGVNYGPGIKEFGTPEAEGLTYEFSREQNPKGKYLVCIRMTQAYVDKWVFFGQPPQIPEPTEEEAEKPEDEREGPVDEDENGNVVERQRYDTLESERVKQKTASTSASEIRKAFTLKTMQEDIERGEQVLKEYAKILRKEGITPEDLNGFDISRQSRLYRKSYAKVKQLLQANDVKFDDKNITDDDKFEFVLDNKFNLMHLLSNETPDKRADLETETKDESNAPADAEVDQSSDTNPPNPDITSIFYDGFDRRDLTEDELKVAQEKSVPVFLPEGDNLEDAKNKRAKKYNLMRDRSRNRLRGWSSTTLSMLANTDKILEQHKNIGTNDLLPWTEFLSQCVYPNPCIKPVEVKQKEEEPKILTSLEETTTNTASEVGQHNAAASLEVKEKKAEQRKQEFNIIENSILNCGVDLEDMIDDLEGLYENVLDKFSFKALLSAAAEKAKNEMRNQAAIFADDVRSGVESEVRKIVDSVISELECGVDIAKGKIEDKFMSPLKEVPGVNDLLSKFEPPEITFDLPSIKITSYLAAITEQIEEAAIDMIESTLISMVSEMVKDFIDCEKVIAIDGVDDKGNGLFDAFSKAAFGEANLADLIPPESVSNIAESLGIPEDRIDSLNNAISEVTNPEELLTLVNGEASEAVLRRLKPIISEQLGGVADMTIEVLASYLARIGDTAPEELKDQIFEAKTETVFCNDLDYQDAAQVMKDILGERAKEEAKNAFDRSKDKIRSLCGLKESAEENLTQAVTEMKTPVKMKQGIDLASNIVTDSHRNIMNPYINEAFAGGTPEQQSLDNYSVYTFGTEYPSIQLGFPEENNVDGSFRLGKFRLEITSGNDEVTYSIHTNSMRFNPVFTYSIPNEGYRLPVQGLGDMEYKRQVNNALNQNREQNLIAPRINDLFTNTSINSKEKLREDIIFYFNDASRRNQRAQWGSELRSTILKIYRHLQENPSDNRIKEARKEVTRNFRNIGSLGILLRCMLPFVMSSYRTLSRAGGGVTPIWYPKDIITNKLVTDYLYQLLFEPNVVGGNWFDVITVDQYNNQPELERTRQANFLESTVRSDLRQPLKERMSELYEVLSSIDIQTTTVTPGIDEYYDQLGNENVAATKKVISLLLNLLLPYKVGGDRTFNTQEQWMGPTISDKISEGLDLRVKFPVQALVALVTIQGFHDNNGWRQITYRGPGDVNFRDLTDAVETLFLKSLEDDDTELPRL